MSLNIGENKYPQQAVVWEVDDKGSYAVVKLGTSRKDKKTGEYANSNWSFVKFVGNAYSGIVDIPLKSRIIIKAGSISLEPYVKDGVKTWPKNPQIVVFAWETYTPKNEDSGDYGAPVMAPDDEEDNPF